MVRVTDGDTIVVATASGSHRVRYIGVDTPETVHPLVPVEEMGREAAAANRSLVEGKRVVLERDVTETDRFGRLLRYVWVPEGDRLLFVNLELVRLGYAQVVTYPPDVRYVDEYLEAQTSAREAGLGLWAGGEAATPSPTASASRAGERGCDPSYPGVCIPPSPPDLDCGDVSFRRFAVLPPDPHRFDGDHDGVGCEGG